jgi:hypothetical protein
MVADLSLFAGLWFVAGVMRAIQGKNGAELLTFRRFFAAEADFKRRC